MARTLPRPVISYPLITTGFVQFVRASAAGFNIEGRTAARVCISDGDSSGGSSSLSAISRSLPMWDFNFIDDPHKAHRRGAAEASL